jgi:hypothetical protein
MQRRVLALCELQDVADATRKSDRDRSWVAKSGHIAVQHCQFKDVRRGFAQKTSKPNSRLFQSAVLPHLQNDAAAKVEAALMG